jgi:type IV pilus assembly protein PilM
MRHSLNGGRKQLARKSREISVLQFDSRHIVWLRVSQSGPEAGILDYALETGRWAVKDGSLAEALKAFIAKHPLAEDRVYTVLPRHEITTRILTLPTHDEDEAANMIRFSAEEYVPFNASELIIDQMILQKLENGESRIFAAFARRDLVETHVNLLSAAGIQPEQILLSTLCLASAARTGLPEADARYALVHLGVSGLEVLVMDKGTLLFSRAIAMAQNWDASAPPEASAQEDVLEIPADTSAQVQDTESGGSGSIFDLPENAGVQDAPPPAGDEAMEELVAEVRGSLSTFRRESEDGLGAEIIYLSSDTADTAKAREVLEERLEKKCLAADFMESISGPGIRKADGTPLNLIGAALTARGNLRNTINLLPETLVQNRRMEQLQRRVLHGGGAVIIVLLALYGLYYQAVAQRAAYIEKLEERIAALEPRARGVKAKQNQLQLLNRQVNRNASALELLARITGEAPEERLNITRFSYDRELGIDLFGRAKTVDDVHDFAQNLRTLAEGFLKFFAQTRSLYEEKAKERNEEIFMYHIAIPFPEEEEGDQFIEEYIPEAE